VSTHGYTAGDSISQNNIHIWSYPTLRQVMSMGGHTDRILYLAYSPDGRTIVTGAPDETLRFWEVFREEPRRPRPVSSLVPPPIR
jgi:cell division cycle 20-like protein 1 (cofactor of APC complex)